MITNYELYAMLLLAVVVVAFAVWMATMEAKLHLRMDQFIAVTGDQDLTPCGIGVFGNGGSAAGTAALPGQHGGPLGTAALPVGAPALGKSPEQICYEAYRGESKGYRPAWDCLPVSEQMAWKAAAVAVEGLRPKAEGLTAEAQRMAAIAADCACIGKEWLSQQPEGIRGIIANISKLASPSPPLPGSHASDYCAGPDDPVIPPHHTGHAERV